MKQIQAREQSEGVNRGSSKSAERHRRGKRIESGQADGD